MKLLLLLLGLLALGWGVTLWKAARHEARAVAEYPPLGQFVTVDGARLHILQVGEGPDIVLIHGASGNMRDFTHDLVPRLAGRYRVTVVDRPGLGHSDRLDRDGATIFEQADVLVRAVAELGVERPLVLGHSYGGAVALAWATRHPEAAAGLILLAAASNPWDTPLSTYYRVLSSPAGQVVAAPLLTAWVPDHVVTDTIASIFAPQPTPEGYADYIGAGLTLQRRALRENALQRAGILEEITRMVPDYAGIEMPVEILHGDADTTVWLSIHSEPLSRQIAGANLVVMDGVGHSPHHAEPGTVIAAIDRAAARAGLR
ncbi:alpha/beta fold hydrolase [Roseicyclus amphidinii]|uniref:alpha/beta fold hydrolase n=1 Tax=Roseicyclus amphidinii TaxID=3034232 RepID=UPI0024E0E30D|nr:alpha/beta hydrolase [Roseicyclus sp. Amp-Y-6]